MKKLLFVFAFGALAVTACNKEVEQEQEQTPQGPTSEMAYIRAVGEDYDITGTTKATLDDAGTFYWATGDQIGVRLYKGDAITGTDGGSGYGAWDATFTLNAADAGKTNGEFEGPSVDEWVKAYTAWYPRYGDESSKTNIGGDAKLYFYLREYYDDYNTTGSRATSLMPMMAYMGGSYVQSNPNASFKHVGAGIRVTLTGVPAIANQVSLTVAGKNIWGWYTIDDPSQAGTASISAGDGSNSTVYLKFDTASEARDMTFIFPLPTVDLSGGITLKLYYGDGHTELWSKTAGTKTPLPALGRGDLLDLPDLPVAEWKTLGTGRFIDNFLWSKITSDSYNTTVDRDMPGYVNVTIQQNVSDPYTFRLVNPYGNAATQFGYTSVNAANRDEYFVFTVAGFAQGNRVTNFVTHRTGFAIDSGHSNPELVYARTYNSEWDPSNDMVVLGGETAPKIVQMAPIYRYNGSSTAYAYSTHLMNRKGVFRIIFPGVTGYGGSLSLPATGDAQLNILEVNKEVSATTTRFRGVVSQYTDFEIASPNVNKYYIGNWPGVVTGANATCTWENTGLATNTTIPSGPVYLTWFIVDSDNCNYVYDQGRTKVYFINANDIAAVGTYKFQSLYSLASFDRSTWKELTSSSDNRMVITTSDDASKGNVMITDMFGLQYDGTVTNKNLTNKDSDSVFELKKSDGALTTWMSTSSFSAGNPVYGYLSDGKVYFKNTTDQVFFKYANTDYVLRNQNTDNPASFSLTYDSSASPVTLTCDARICIVPPSRYTGYVDGAWSLLWNSKTAGDTAGIVGEKQ